MRKAIVKNGVVENVIEIEADACAEYAAVAECELFDIAPWGIWIGDTYDGVDFWRGEQKLPLPVVPPEAPDAATMEAALNELGVQTRE